ncbi:CRISPR-associated helicase Cas3' [Gordonia spumicola]|nr:CRISPR-associated helicase Cas3' [Gordonia spumicola]
MKPPTPDTSRQPGAMSARARVLWAKSDYDAPENWMPLYQHMADSAAVASQLWDEFLPSAVKLIVTESMDGDDARAKRLAVFLASGHDAGKASPAFACQVDGLRSTIADSGLPFHVSVDRNRSKLPHSAAGKLIQERWLVETRGFHPTRADMYAAIALGHHGSFTPPAPVYADGSAELLGSGTLWEATQNELMEYVATLAGLTDDDFDELRSLRLTQPAAIVIVGLTVMADWIASNTYYFPLTTAPRDVGAAAEAMNRLRLPAPWRTEDLADAEIFADHLRLDAPRPLQTTLVALARTLESPELLILEAPTGDGKTKAALGASEILAARFGLGGVMFALPTQATSDGILGPVLDWLDAANGSGTTSLVLAHGKAEFNDEYQDIVEMSRVYDNNDADGQVIAHSFLTGRAKLTTMSDFVVGTIDQLLLGALRSKHVALRHLGLAGKVVIIDECHAADAYMRVYLCRMLTWLAAYGVPVIAMSATLTPSIRAELLTAYNDGLGRYDDLAADEVIVYPRITRTSDNGSEIIAVPASSRTAVLTIGELPGEADTVASAAAEAASTGANVAVVCNAVNRAQSVYRAVRSLVPDGVDVVLLHSRFLAPDRAAREQRLRERLGPDTVRDPATRPVLVVATQVIEQSLDIDFDVMFSDIAPIDLLLQRAGRLHRHDWKHGDRPAQHQTATLTLTGFTREDVGPPVLDSGCTAVYGTASLLRAIATIDEHFQTSDVITSPDDVAVLVTRAYETITAPSGWEDAWATATTADEEARVKQQNKAEDFLLDPPTSKSLTGWSERQAADPTTSERGAAQVRDTEDTIEVVVVQRVGRTVVIPTWAADSPGAQVENSTVVDDDVARAAAMNTLRLPGFLGRQGIGDRLIDELEQNGVDCWQNSRWLRGALPLVLDTNGDAEHVDFLFHYDTELGLVLTPLEKS